MRTRSLLLESFRLAYWLLRRLLEFLVLLARSKQRKEVEILLVRHELQVLRRTELLPQGPGGRGRPTTLGKTRQKRTLLGSISTLSVADLSSE
jgi:hypothetical protein